MTVRLQNHWQHCIMLNDTKCDLRERPRTPATEILYIQTLLI